MSLRPDPLGHIPAETARVARAAFPRGNLYLRMRDELGQLYVDADFAALYPTRGQPALAPWRLALVLVWQFVERLSDRQAADAVRARIDWKYALGLALDDPGFDASVLSEFRARLVAGGHEEHLLTAMLDRFRARGLLAAGGRQRTDATHVLAAVRGLNRLECVGETLRHALTSLAVAVPDWLRAHLDPAWIDRYAARVDDFRLPKEAAARQEWAEVMGADGMRLLTTVDAALDLPWLRDLPAVATLRLVWIQQFLLTAEGTLHWRGPDDTPPARTMINSPYDAEARYSIKRTTSWVGYKVHLTETCDPTTPHLITQVSTTPAPVPDFAMTEPIQNDLATQHLRPAEHVVDAGYVDAANLVASQARGIDLVGPAPVDNHWQARAGRGFDVGSFALDWETRSATCPDGKRSTKWSATHNRHGEPIVNIRFARADCAVCPHRADCTTAQKGPREITVRPREQHLALQAARQRQESSDFAARYAVRAGVEGTLSQGVRVCGLRRARYVGLAKVHLEHTLAAAALNLKRVEAWWDGVPLATTRPSPLIALAAA